MAGRRIKTVDVPQANTLAYVGELISLIEAGYTSKRELAKRIGIEPRQVDYYMHAARILSFLDIEKRPPKITRRGSEYLKALRPPEKRNLLVSAVRDNEIFRMLFERYAEPELTKTNIVRFLRHNTSLTGKTIPRRAETIIAWLKQILPYDPENLKEIALRVSEQAEVNYRGYVSGREGPLHYELKSLISKEPAVLGENLVLVAVEFGFPTNDRADILFLDRKERFLVVEVEVYVGAYDIPGLLQAVKYKSLIEVLFGLDPGKARGMLAARKIHPLIKNRAKRYGIEIKEVKEII